MSHIVLADESEEVLIEAAERRPEPIGYPMTRRESLTHHPQPPRHGQPMPKNSVSFEPTMSAMHTRKLNRIMRNKHWRREQHHPVAKHTLLALYLLGGLLGVLVPLTLDKPKGRKQWSNYLQRAVELVVMMIVGIMVVSCIFSTKGNSRKVLLATNLYHVIFATSVVVRCFPNDGDTVGALLIIIGICISIISVIWKHLVWIYHCVRLPSEAELRAVERVPRRLPQHGGMDTEDPLTHTRDRLKGSFNTLEQLEEGQASSLEEEFEVVIAQRAHPLTSRLCCCFQSLQGWHTSTYRGPLVPNGRGLLVPHGLGEWYDTAKHGEYLYGWWRNGFPLGPFMSVSVGNSSNVYVKLRIVFATNHGTGTEKVMRRSPLIYGVAQISVSVAGFFYTDYPRTSLGVIPTSDKLEDVWPAWKCLRMTPHLPPMSSEWDSTEDGPDILLEKSSPPPSPPANPKKSVNQPLRRNLRLSSDYLLAKQSKHQQAEGPKVALLFIHGYNHAFNDGLTELAQLAGLASFPASVVPVMFSWAAGSALKYFDSVTQCKSQENISDLQDVFAALGRQGITEVHVMTHSMGARCLYYFAKKASLAAVFRSVGDHGSARSSPAMSGKQDMTGEEEEPEDWSLDPHANPVELGSIILVSPDLEVSRFEKLYGWLSKYCDHFTVYSDKRDLPVRMAKCIRCEKAALGHWIHALECGEGVEIIDCSHTETNTAKYHSYFFATPLIVEDIRDIVVSRKRAWQRLIRLAPKTFAGGIFQFKSVPSGVGFCEV